MKVSLKKIEPSTAVRATPFIWIRRHGDSYLIDGPPYYAVGHKVNRTAGERADGIFIEWCWDGRCLKVSNDRHGFHPLYYFTRPGEIALSDSIPKLVELYGGDEFDVPGMAVFLRLGFFISDDTPFKHIRAVPICTTFRWESGELEVKTPSSAIRAESMGRSSAIDAYISLFKQSMRRRAPVDHNFSLPISGGRDSRHILLELCDSGNRPETCVTADIFPYAVSEDVETAKRLTNALDLSHDIVYQPGERLAAELRNNFETNFCADEHSWYLPVADYLRARTNVVYDGIGGDVLSAGLFLNKDRLDHFEAGRFEKLAADLMSEEEPSETVIAEILPPDHYKRFGRDLATAHICEELKRHAGRPNPVSSFYFANRTRREIALSPYRLLLGIEKVFSPYLDYDLYDFLTSLPAGMLIEHDFHTEAIHRAFPAYSDIPFAKRSRAKVRSPRYFRKFTFDLIRYVYANRPVQLVSYKFLAKSLAHCLTDYRLSHYVRMYGPWAAYLIQVQRLLAD